MLNLISVITTAAENRRLNTKAMRNFRLNIYLETYQNSLFPPFNVPLENINKSGEYTHDYLYFTTLSYSYS